MRIILRGRTVCKGMAEGEALVSRNPFMFASYVDMGSGVIYAQGHELEGKNVKDKVMVFPCGKGSTGNEASLFQLKSAGAAPKAVVAGSAIYTPGVIAAILADIPMVYGFDQNCLGFIENGDHVKVDADNGIVEVTKK
ncbi:aconitase X swivel domain-containing protein [Chloroflexota bacterium]